MVSRKGYGSSLMVMTGLSNSKQTLGRMMFHIGDGKVGPILFIHFFQILDRSSIMPCMVSQIVMWTILIKTVKYKTPKCAHVDWCEASTFLWWWFEASKWFGCVVEWTMFGGAHCSVYLLWVCGLIGWDESWRRFWRLFFWHFCVTWYKIYYTRKSSGCEYVVVQ